VFLGGFHSNSALGKHVNSSSELGSHLG
jgi:hypothetical protein